MPGFISCTEVTGGWWLSSHARKAVIVWIRPTTWLPSYMSRPHLPVTPEQRVQPGTCVLTLSNIHAGRFSGRFGSLIVHTYIHMYIHTYVHTYIDIHTYIHTYIRTYIHTYIRTYMHVYCRCVQCYCRRTSHIMARFHPSPPSLDSHSVPAASGSRPNSPSLKVGTELWQKALERG